MSRHPRTRTIIRNMVAVVATLTAACERSQTVPAADSTVPLRPAPIGTSTATPPATWDARLGPVLLVAGGSPDAATIVIGDSARAGTNVVSERDANAIRSTPAILVGRGDSVEVAILEEALIGRREDGGRGHKRP